MEIIDITAKIVLILSALVLILGFGYLAILEVKDLIKEK